MDHARWHALAWEQYQGPSWNDSGEARLQQALIYQSQILLARTGYQINHFLTQIYGNFKVFLGHGGGLDSNGNELPRLVYVSREKRPGFQHHKKAGAMNALVSS